MILLVLIALQSSSQTNSAISDTGFVCIPMSQARAAIKVIDSFKIMKQELFLVKMQYSVLQERFSLREEKITEFQMLVANSKKKEQNLDMQVFNLETQAGIKDVTIKGLKKDIKKEKGKVRIIGGISIGIIGLLTYFAVK